MVCMSERVAKMIEVITPILCFSILHALCTILRYMHYIFLHAGVHHIPTVNFTLVHPSGTATS